MEVILNLCLPATREAMVSIRFIYWADLRYGLIQPMKILNVDCCCPIQKYLNRLPQYAYHAWFGWKVGTTIVLAGKVRENRVIRWVPVLMGITPSVGSLPSGMLLWRFYETSQLSFKYHRWFKPLVYSWLSQHGVQPLVVSSSTQVSGKEPYYLCNCSSANLSKKIWCHHWLYFDFKCFILGLLERCISPTTRFFGQVWRVYWFQNICHTCG